MILDNLTFYRLTYTAKSCFTGTPTPYTHLVAKVGECVSIVTTKDGHDSKYEFITGSVALRTLSTELKKTAQFNISDVELVPLEISA